MRSTSGSFRPFLLLFVLTPAAPATTWYVNGASGNDSHNCSSSTTACKTIGHAISLASSGDTIMVAAATYTENLTVNLILTIDGAGASTTIIDGQNLGPWSRSPNTPVLRLRT
jgi:hypothetical protein